MARLVGSLIVLGIVLLVRLIQWLAKKDNPGSLAGFAPTRRTPADAQFIARGGNPASLLRKPSGTAPLFGAPGTPGRGVLPTEGELLLSPNTLYPELDQAITKRGFARVDGPSDGDPPAARWTRGATTVRYAYRSDIQLRGLSFEGDDGGKARTELAASVPWLSSDQVLDLLCGEQPWEILLGLEASQRQRRPGDKPLLTALLDHTDERIRTRAQTILGLR